MTRQGTEAIVRAVLVYPVQKLSFKGRRGVIAGDRLGPQYGSTEKQESCAE
jgi:hypothetical protein